jgi:hypothetical protein
MARDRFWLTTSPEYSASRHARETGEWRRTYSIQYGTPNDPCHSDEGLRGLGTIHSPVTQVYPNWYSEEHRERGKNTAVVPRSPRRVQDSVSENGTRYGSQKVIF